ncbi:MAG: tRNA uridine(34) 5-carboxymethylaminomethyl modification radical SAM/GNAT enzyme Elp3 [Candidatus Asgardarchaeia archaeon]
MEVEGSNVGEGLMERIYKEIIEEIIKSGRREEVNRIKIKVSRKYGLHRIPGNSEVLNFAKGELREKLRPILMRKPVRYVSGVTVISVMTKPLPCPHGRCLYCPGGPGSVLGDVPQSYTGYEPTTMRGIQNDYDPYRQVRNRLEQLFTIGHIPQKVELIVMGGTFTSVDRSYQDWFIKRCFDALNGRDSKDLEEAKRLNEKASIRNVGLTIETRPDYAKEKHADLMLYWGTTRVELGVQTVYDDVYELVKRGHKVEDVVEATRILKDSGFKINYHMMPGLPGSSFERDLEAFRTIFEDDRFKPDMLKIYPTLVIKGTVLYDWWKEGKYRPYTDEEAAELISEILHIIPRWIRIQRMQRDIPAKMIEAGPKKGNLRQIAKRLLWEKYGEFCHCIRCREVGHRWMELGILPDLDEIKLYDEKYEASEGIEHFISFEDKKRDVLIGFLRLRIPSEKAHRPEVKGAAIVRELHVFGPQILIGRHPKDYLSWQHRGYGRKLLEYAENLALEKYGVKKILVISGVGVREYYFRLGYRRDGPYVSKPLR